MPLDRPSRLRRYRAPIAGLAAALAIVAGASTYSAVSAAPPVVDTSPAEFVPLATPRRIMDTRTGLGAPDAPIGSAQFVDLVVGTPTGTETGVPADASGVVLNVTVAFPTQEAFVSVFPFGDLPEVLTSNVNFLPGMTVANQVTVALGADGANKSVRVYNGGGETEVIVDVFGYYINPT